MKRKITFLIAALCAVMLITQPMRLWGQKTNYVYELATSIAANDDIVIVNTGFTKELTNISSNIGTASDISNSTISGNYILTVCTGSETGSFSFKNGSVYMALTSDGNNLHTVDKSQKNSSWTVSIDENTGEATITNCNYTSRALKYNSSNPRFCCYTTSQTAIKIYKRVEAKVATPKFSPVGGSYLSAQDVAISTTTNGATIYYTTDGNTPTTNSSVYSSAIHVDSDMTIKAFATKNGLTNSDVAEAAYSIVQAQNLTITSEHGTPTVTVNSSPVTPTNNVYSIPQGATVNLSVAAADGYAFSGWTVDSGGVTISNNSFTMPSNAVVITANYDAVVVDNLTASLVNAAASSSKTYTDWSGIKINTAVYAGNSNINDPASNYIQLNSGSPKGIVTTTSGGYAKKVSVTFVNSTSSGRTITVYGKNTAYSGPADLYDNDKRGTSLGTIVCGTNTEITISGNYQYIGLLANGALYVEPITVTWLPLTFYSVTYTDKYYVSETQVGAVTVSKTSATAGETITITAEGMNHYHFNGWTVLDENSDEVELTGTNPATFTMPASDVEVEAAWEEDTKYDIAVEAESEDYILVKDEEYAGETVTIQISDIPSGQFIDEVTVTKDGGGTVDNVTYTGQEEDYYNYTFTMPADGVTIEVSFKDPDTYRVTYYVKGIEDGYEDVTEGSSVTLPTSTSTSIDGFTLLGWSTTNGGTTTLPAGAYYPDSDIDLYAVLGVVTNTSITITHNSTNFPESYGSLAEYTLEGKKFKIQQVYKNGKMQWRSADHASGAGFMYNSEDFGKILSIVIVFTNDSQTKNFVVKAGTSENPTSGTTINPDPDYDNENNEIFVYTFDFSGDDYNYFRITNGSGAGYLASITIYYEENATVGTVTEYSSIQTLSDDIEEDECIVVKNGGVLTFSGDNNGNAANLIVEDGGQLIVNSEGIQATIKKTLPTGSGKATNWTTIASPVKNINIGTPGEIGNVTHLKDVDYALYRYNEVSMEWENHKNTEDHADFTTLESGRGYLYSRTSLETLSYVGEVNGSDYEEYTLSITTANAIKGFHLIGNPYSHDIYKGAAGNGYAIPNSPEDGNPGYVLASGFYQLKNGTSWTPKLDDGTKIEKGEGILVQATTAGTLRIYNSATKPAKRANHDNIMFTVANSQYEDVAYALFDKGMGLNKIDHRDANAPMLFIPQNGENFAIATMSDNTKSFNLNFKAMTTGKYTLSAKANGNYSYLHIFDRMTGNDVDMLLEGEYSFISSPNDNENRFIVNLAYLPDYGESNDIFAYQSGSDIYVTGQGELQIFDVTGRQVMTTTINGAESINLSAKGVFIFRLIGSDVKTQKIVVE